MSQAKSKSTMMPLTVSHSVPIAQGPCLLVMHQLHDATVAQVRHAMMGTLMLGISRCSCTSICLNSDLALVD